MNASTINRCPGFGSFIICFYCKENFRSLESLLKHCCSAEEKISLDWEPLEIISNTDSNYLDQEDSVVSVESVSEKLSDISRQEITEAESNASNVGETSFSETECEKALSEAKSNAVRQEITEISSDTTEKRLSEPNLDVPKEVELVTDSSEKRLLEPPPSKAGEVTDESKKQLSVANSNIGQKITEEFNRASPDLVSKVLQYYEKQTKSGSPDVCCKSPSAEVEFQSALSLSVETGSPEHDVQMELGTANNCNKSLSSETKGSTSGENIIQKESDTLKHNARNAMECQASNTCSRLSPRIESNLSNMFSRSSVEQDLDSLGCSDDQADSDYSDASNTLSVKNSDSLKHDHIQMESHVSDNSVNSVPEKNLNITKHNSGIVKPCYVEVQDIFKPLANAKISPQKIFSWKKKYHVCDVCSKFFRLRSDLNIHYLIHTTVKPYVCNICDKSFIKQCNLFAHHLSHTVERYHVCSICKKAFSKMSLLLKHEQIHTKEKPYTCEKCNKSYSVKSSLTEHYLSHSDVRPFICEICSASFANKRYLRRHYYSHQNKNHVCDFCFKTFKRKNHLEDHYNVHINDKPHKCKICSKSFHLLLSLNNHYATAHKNERAFIFSESIKTSADHKIAKNPVIQKIEVFAEVDKSKQTPVIEKSSVYVSKETVSYSTRRKSFTPKKYLQPD